MASLLQSLGTHYSKPDAGRRVAFAAGAAVKTTPTQVDTPNEIQNESDALLEGDSLTEALSGEHSQATEEAVLVGEEDGSVEEEKYGEEQRKKEIELVLKTRKSFLRSTIACVCAHCITTVARRRSVEHCTLLCVALRMYGDAETVVRIQDDNQTRFIAGVMGGGRGESEAVGDLGSVVVDSGGEREGRGKGEGNGGDEGEGLTGEVGDRGEMGDRREVGDGGKVGENGKREERGRGEGVQQLSVTEVVVYLSGCLLGAMDGSVISGCDPQLVEGVVSSILLLLQTEGVSLEAVTKLLHQIVQVLMCPDDVHVYVCTLPGDTCV